MKTWREYGENIPNNLLLEGVPEPLDPEQRLVDRLFSSRADFQVLLDLLGIPDNDMFDELNSHDKFFTEITSLAIAQNVSYFVAEQRFYKNRAEARRRLAEETQMRISERISKIIYSR